MKRNPSPATRLLPTHSHDPCLWGSPMLPLVVHQPASPSIWPAVQSLRRGSVHKSSGDNMGAVEEMMCVVCVDGTEGA